MTWQAHLQHTSTGLAIQFATPVDRLDMTPDVAQHFASLIAIEARARVAGVVRTLEAENGSRTIVGKSPNSQDVRKTDTLGNVRNSHIGDAVAGGTLVVTGLARNAHFD